MSCEHLQHELRRYQEQSVSQFEKSLAFSECDRLQRECNALPSSNRATLLRTYSGRGYTDEQLENLDNELYQKALNRAEDFLQSRQESDRRNISG